MLALSNLHHIPEGFNLISKIRVLDNSDPGYVNTMAKIVFRGAGSSAERRVDLMNWFNPAGDSVGVVTDSGTIVVPVAGSGADLTEGQWHRVEVEADGVGDTLSVWLDDHLIVSGVAMADNLDGYIGVGCHGFGGAVHFDYVLAYTGNRSTAKRITALSVPAEFRPGAYPNPFNSGTMIRYRVDTAGPVTLTVYNTLGQRISTLVNTYQEAGEYSLAWSGRDDAGHDAASGVYVHVLQAGGRVESRKMTLIR